MFAALIWTLLVLACPFYTAMPQTQHRAQGESSLMHQGTSYGLPGYLSILMAHILLAF